MKGLRSVAFVCALVASALTATGCGLLCSEQELLGVDAPGHGMRARAVSRACDQERWLAIMLVDARTGDQTVLMESKDLVGVSMIWTSATVLQVTLFDVPRESANHVTDRAVRRVGNVAVEYYVSAGKPGGGLSPVPPP